MKETEEQSNRREDSGGKEINFKGKSSYYSAIAFFEQIFCDAFNIHPTKRKWFSEHIRQTYLFDGAEDHYAEEDCNRVLRDAANALSLTPERAVVLDIITRLCGLLHGSNVYNLTEKIENGYVSICIIIDATVSAIRVNNFKKSIENNIDHLLSYDDRKIILRFKKDDAE